MLAPEDIIYLVGVAAGIWAIGFSYGKSVAWVRALRTAA